MSPPRITDCSNPRPNGSAGLGYAGVRGNAPLPNLCRWLGGAAARPCPWRQPLDVAWRSVGHTRAVQGNLDPHHALRAGEILELKVKEILRLANGRPGHIFNLGHGIVPGTPVEVVRIRCGQLAHGFRPEEGNLEEGSMAKTAALSSNT